MIEWDISNCFSDSKEKLAERLKKSLAEFSEVKIIFPSDYDEKIKIATAMYLAGWKLMCEDGTSGVYVLE